jgi:hypothetical protein
MAGKIDEEGREQMEATLAKAGVAGGAGQRHGTNSGGGL